MTDTRVKLPIPPPTLSFEGQASGEQIRSKSGEVPGPVDIVRVTTAY